MKKVTPETEHEIRRLAEIEKWPKGTIATQLGIHHEVVERVLREASSSPSPAVREKMIDPFRPFIAGVLEQYPQVPGSRLYLMIRERGYPGSQSHFRKQLAKLRPRKQLEPFLRLRKLIAEEAQVDWGDFGPLEVDGCQRRLSAFVMTLSFSRAIWLQFFLDMKMGNFLRGHVDAFKFFGGVPRVLLYDNLKSAVIERDGSRIHFNEQLLELASHYGFTPRAAGVRRGNEKGVVERSIGYVRTSFFSAREVKSIRKLNEQAEKWTQEVALNRPHPDDDSRTVRAVFEGEMAKLRRLPSEHFPTYDRITAKVGKTPWVKFDRNEYSLPPQFVRREVSILSDHESVRIVADGQIVAEHQRSFGRKQAIEDPKHTEELIQIKRRAQRPTQSRRIVAAVPSAEAFLGGVQERRKSLSHSLHRLDKLLARFGSDALQNALSRAISEGRFTMSYVQAHLEMEAEKHAAPVTLPLKLSRSELEEIRVREVDLSHYDKKGDDDD